jgi:acyl carrier protein
MHAVVDLPTESWPSDRGVGGCGARSSRIDSDHGDGQVKDRRIHNGQGAWMDREGFLKKFEELLEVAPNSLLEDTELEQVESWDSLNVIGFIALVDETFQKEVDPDKIAECKTVGNLVDLAVG